jgi:hypothetical protein
MYWNSQPSWQVIHLFNFCVQRHAPQGSLSVKTAGVCRGLDHKTTKDLQFMNGMSTVIFTHATAHFIFSQRAGMLFSVATSVQPVDMCGASTVM